MEQSKKGQVIALAKADPFLTVKDLAKEAATTTRYVRTILSEAQLSLHEMRRSYARRLQLNAGVIELPEDISVQEELTITKVVGGKVVPDIPSWAELELFQASIVRRSSSVLCYVQLLTPEQLTISVKPHDLRELLPEWCRAKLEIGGQKAMIQRAPEGLAAALALPEPSQIVKLMTFLTVDDRPVAVELKWFGLEGMILQWSKLQPELEVRLGS